MYTRHSSGKYLFYALEYLLLYRLVLNLNRVGELGQQILLFSREFRRNDDVHSDIEIASSRSAALGDTAPFDAESRTGLRSRRNGKLLIFAVDSRHCDLSAKGSLRECDWNVTVEVMVTSFEELVLLYAENDVQISGRTTFCPGVALSRHSHLRTGVDTRGDSQFERLFPHNPAVAP